MTEMLANCNAPEDPSNQSNEVDYIANSKDGQRRGGGPRSPEGRATSSQNAVTHGILSTNPVAGGESFEDWEAFLEELRAHLQPVGAYEEDRVYRIALDGWSLRRIDRCTASLINLRYEAIDAPIPRRKDRTLPGDLYPEDYKKPQVALLVLEHLNRFNEDALLEHAVVQDILLATISTGPAVGVDLDADIPGVGALRKVIAQIAEVRGVSEAEVVVDAAIVLGMAIRYSEELKQEAELRRKIRTARAFLPDYPDLDKLLRYKTQYERSMERQVKMLEVSQRARNNDLPAPIRLDVTRT